VRTLLGAIYAYPGGVVVDRWGHRRAFLVFNVVSIVGYAVVLLVPHWSGVLAGMFCSSPGAVFPCRQHSPFSRRR
jgi:MFS family permease